MITAYLKSNLKPVPINHDNIHLLADSLWLDVFAPTKEDEFWILQQLNIDIPTREEMQEIEPSSRLYIENDCIFMTAYLLVKSETIDSRNEVITFIFNDDKLITIRYADAHAITFFIARLNKLKHESYHAVNLTIELLGCIIERIADVIEKIGASLNEYSKNIFLPDTIESNGHTVNYKIFLKQVGINGDLSSKVGESLISFNLLILFFAQIGYSMLNNDLKSKLDQLEKDIKALSNHVHFLSNKVNFLLDATLGMVTIEQNEIIRIFSIAAVILLPPTLIASIYGMNFKVMPELLWSLGYPFAIGLMIASSVLSYLFFKKKKWI